MYASTDGSTIASVTMQQSHARHMTIMCYNIQVPVVAVDFICLKMERATGVSSSLGAKSGVIWAKRGREKRVNHSSSCQPHALRSSIIDTYTIRRNNMRITRIVILVTPSVIITWLSHYSHVIHYSSHMTALTSFLSVTNMVRYLCSSPTTIQWLSSFISASIRCRRSHDRSMIITWHSPHLFNGYRSHILSSSSDEYLFTASSDVEVTCGS